MDEEYIDHPILQSLADHTDKLEEYDDKTKKVMKKFNEATNLTERNLEVMDMILSSMIHAIGDMSLTRTKVEKTLKDHYSKTYKTSPALGRELFKKHYASLHQPYNKAKDKIWKSIFVLDDYKKKHF